MPRFLAVIALAAVMATMTDAFVVGGRRSAAGAVKTFSPFDNETPFSTTTTSTQLQLKIDPNTIKKGNNKNASGMAKGAAYGGSVAVAVLLPVAFLAWAALH